jgi:hypothetical protein
MASLDGVRVPVFRVWELLYYGSVYSLNLMKFSSLQKSHSVTIRKLSLTVAIIFLHSIKLIKTFLKKTLGIVCPCLKST